tara:strand:+ start:162 stop:824 length:663 start_codon:yes stop_codon:yes gene_type:complete
MYISTDAIILKNTPYKESSIISRIFTLNHGKISIIFKGAKKNKNNIPAIIEPGNVISITYYNNNSSLKTAKEVQIKKTYYNTRKILNHYYYTMAIISILDKLSYENHPEEEMFNLSLKVFNDIDNGSARIDIIFIYFLFQLSKSLGFELSYSSTYTDLIDELNSSNSNLSDIEGMFFQDSDSIKKIKIMIYKHMRDHLIDLNELHTVKILRNHGKPSRSN